MVTCQIKPLNRECVQAFETVLNDVCVSSQKMKSHEGELEREISKVTNTYRLSSIGLKNNKKLMSIVNVSVKNTFWVGMCNYL